MDFSLEYTEEQEAFAKEVRTWIEENVPKDIGQERDPQKLTREEFDKRRELGRKLGQKGWLAPGSSPEYGGGGLGAESCFVLYDEFAKRGIGLPTVYDIGHGLAVPAILRCCTEEQKKRFLPPIYKGEAVTWQLFTEPDTGTDVASQQTNALRHVRDKDSFIVNGGKIFVGGVHAPPDQFLLLTRSDVDAPRYENLAMFIAPADLPGITITPLDLFPSGGFAQACGPLSAQAPGVKHSVFFDDVRIHESHLIGGERDGWMATNATLMAEHGDRFGGPGGVRRIDRNQLWEKIIHQCKNNPNVYKRIQENPLLLDTLANIYIEYQTIRLFTTRNAWLLSTGQREPGRGPQVNLYAKEQGNRLSSEIAELLGPYALVDDGEWGMEDGFFEIGQRGAIQTAAAGTPEAMKIIISRALSIGR
jgi:alkylation response protein AidB-like acyl-CoA dehydrogenase